MPKIMLNGIEYAGSGGTGNTTTIELTQAEYDALPSTKLTDNITYYITDAQAGAPLATEIAMSTSDNTSVADKIDELDEKTDSIPLITYEDVLGTTGTTQYIGYYYVDLTKTASGYIIGALVIDATSNRVAFCQRISATKIRVYSPVAETTVTVRILLSNKFT